MDIYTKWPCFFNLNILVQCSKIHPEPFLFHLQYLPNKVQSNF